MTSTLPLITFLPHQLPHHHKPHSGDSYTRIILDDEDDEEEDKEEEDDEEERLCASFSRMPRGFSLATGAQVASSSSMP